MTAPSRLCVFDMTKESPRDLYHRLEKELSPLLRSMLADRLPVVGGRSWWDVCVLSSLSPIQRDFVRDEQTLEQFDYPALVNIVYKNWRTLRPALGVGNEFTNYLFDLKTFRNDVEHQPDLVLSDERRAHLEQSVRLAVGLLTKTPAASVAKRDPLLTKAMKAGVVATVIATTGFLVKTLWPVETAPVTPQPLAAVPAVMPATATPPQSVDKPLHRLDGHLSTTKLNVCLRYQRVDGTWSKRYTVRGTLEPGKRLNALLETTRFDDARQHLVVYWKRSDDYTIIPLQASETTPPEVFTTYHDAGTRAWEVKSGWDGCRENGA